MISTNSKPHHSDQQEHLYSINIHSFELYSFLSLTPYPQSLLGCSYLIHPQPFIMKTATLLSTLILGLASASPLQKRQDLPIGDYDSAIAAGAGSDSGPPVGDAAPESVVSYDPTKVASEIVAHVTEESVAEATKDTAEVINVDIKRRGTPVTCTTRTFNGPRVTDPADTLAAFQNNPEFAEAATNAAKAANVPSGYAVVPGFVNLKASNQDPSYLTYISSKLTGYNPEVCAQHCNTLSGCNGFNICKSAGLVCHSKIYANQGKLEVYERVPLIISPVTQTPDSSSCPGLVTSPSATLIKCAFYGMPIEASKATNFGQLQGQFQVARAGSNAYIKTSAPSLDTFTGPVSFGNRTINAPAPVIENGYLRVQTFGTNVPFEPALCAASCDAQTAYNAKHGTFGGKPCIFFNAYIFYKNGQDGVFTCAYYSTPYGAARLLNKGQKDNSGNSFTPAMSYGYYKDGHYVA